MGARSIGDAAAALKSQAERAIGIETVRGHARLKLNRLAAVTGDVDAAAERRSNSRFGARSYRDAYNRARGPRVWTPRPSRNSSF